ncbi:unknown protein [Cronobacter turicensis z3032]|jgi:hypothetical protein|uniref:Uncharacterized protein n=1 Tax=Cronobacter turicensis (strain DSM 18703 / CCUG 55852 / LMG 23827 / z3032) TaxID=693216 RepID=C9XU08_CROTZ|nr:unknown protein [Cronobacter turicensis z3032]
MVPVSFGRIQKCAYNHKENVSTEMADERNDPCLGAGDPEEV